MKLYSMQSTYNLVKINISQLYNFLGRGGFGDRGRGGRGGGRGRGGRGGFGRGGGFRGRGNPRHSGGIQKSEGKRTTFEDSD